MAPGELVTQMTSSEMHGASIDYGILHAAQTDSEDEKPHEPAPFQQILEASESSSRHAAQASLQQTLLHYTEYSCEKTPTKDVRRWRIALERAAKELQSESVAVWLRLCDLDGPFMADRNVDIGVRILAPAEKPGSFTLTEGYTDVSSYLWSVGVTHESGWVVRSMGCSLFVHGPHVLFNLIATGTEEFSDRLFEEVVPPQLTQTAKEFDEEKYAQKSIQADMFWGKLIVGLRFELSQGHFDTGLREFGQRFGIGPNQVFDALLMERVVRMLRDAGGKVKGTAIECRGLRPARFTLML